MKKLTKTQKQNIKRKATKILNIASYVLSALFVLILIISMCKGCDSKSVNNNELDSRQKRRNNEIQYAIDNDTDYLLDNRSYMYSYGYNDNDIPFISIDNLFLELQQFYDNDFLGYANFAINNDDTEERYRVNNVKSYQITYNDGQSVCSITFTDFYNHQEVFNLVLSEYSNEVQWFLLFTFNSKGTNNKLPIAPIIINYFYFDDNGYWPYSYVSYELPPYLRIDSYVKGFSIDIGGFINLNNNNSPIRFYKFEYAYHDSLYFYSDNNMKHQWELINIDSEGNYYFSYRTRIYADMFLPGQQPFMYETYTSIPKITFTSFGTKGKSFLDTYFINKDNNIFGGNFFININYINNLIYNAENTTNGYKTYKVHFRFNDVYYQSLTIYSYLNTTFTNSTFIIYFNLGSELYIPTSRILLEYTPVTNQTLYKVSSELIDVEDDNYITNTVIYFEDNVLSVDLYNLIGTYFVPYVNDNYFDIGSTEEDYNYGNVFGLLGGAFSGIASILAITIIPGISIGVLLFIPLIIIIILFIIDLFKR